MNITELKPALIWNIFDQITRCLRPSKKEGKIHEFLCEFRQRTRDCIAKPMPWGMWQCFKPGNSGLREYSRALRECQACGAARPHGHGVRKEQ